MKCTQCGNELKDIRAIISLGFEVERLSDVGIWESVPNSLAHPTEKLCKQCFSDFVDVIDKVFNEGKNVQV